MQFQQTKPHISWMKSDVWQHGENSATSRFQTERGDRRGRWIFLYSDWWNLNRILSNGQIACSGIVVNVFWSKVINSLTFGPNNVKTMAQNVNPFLEQQTEAVKQSEDLKKCPGDSHAVTKRYFL